MFPTITNYTTGYVEMNFHIPLRVSSQSGYPGKPNKLVSGQSGSEEYSASIQHDW